MSVPAGKSQGPASPPGFERADRLGPSHLAALPAAGGPVELVPTEMIVAPELDLSQACQLWTKYLDLRDVILDDQTCYDLIGGKREMNRTGATRLATVFGLSIEQLSIEEGRIQDDEGNWGYRYRVIVRVSKGKRHVDGIGSCRISEISEETGDFSKREHFALTRASTRATKRAIADILGGTEA